VATFSLLDFSQIFLQDFSLDFERSDPLKIVPKSNELLRISCGELVELW